MKTSNQLKTLLAAIAALSLGAITTQAATTWNGNIDSDFSDDNNWSNQSPGDVGIDELATIGNGDTVNLTSNYSAANTYRLTVNGNSTLNVSASVTTEFLNISAGSTVNLLPGSAYTMTQHSTNNNGGWSINGTLEISGGTHVFNERMFGTGLIHVIGDAASINLHQTASAMNYEFDFASTGVSPIVGAGGFPWFSLSSATVDVDASALPGTGIGEYRLFDYNTAGSFLNLSNVTITPPAGLAGVSGIDVYINQYVQDGRNRIDLKIAQAAPEPSTLGLLLIGGAMLNSTRKRLKK